MFLHQPFFVYLKSLQIQYTMTNLQEVWLPITNYEGLYEISDIGRVKSCKRHVQYKGRHGEQFYRYIPEKIKKCSLDRDGYVCAKLSKHGKKTHFTVHRLVAIHFIPNPYNKPTVNHKSGIKTDNRVSQLEWATISEQSIHAYANGLRVVQRTKSMMGRFGIRHNRSKPVIQLDLDGNFIIEFECANEAGRLLGLWANHIGGCCRGESKTHGGFKWQFKILELTP